jgi:arylsulfatase A-like enzyme
MAPGGLPLSQTTLANRMKTLGYATCAVGKWHLGGTADHLPMARGFDEYYGVVGNPGTYFEPAIIDSRVAPAGRRPDDPDFYTTEAFATRAADWIERHKDSPWFLYLPFNAIHGPREAPERYRKRFAHVANENDRTLFAMTAALDDAVGVVLAKVRALGLEDKTLIYFISDNGAPGHIDGNGILRGRKHTTWEGGIRLPFIVQWKGHLPAGKVYEQPVVQLDVMPTCIAAAGGAVDPSWKLDGVNLLPYLSGENPASARPHQDLYWRIDGMWAIRHGDWKLVHGQAGPSLPELFDLAADVSERHDLAAAQPERVQELKALWDAWNAEQSAPQQAKAKAAKKAARKAAKKAAKKAAAGGS